MVTAKDCLSKYGPPEQEHNLTLWDVPAHINKLLPTVPDKIYCNKDLIFPLEQAFFNVLANGLEDEIMTWDGCFNIRKTRGARTMSLHSWAIAIDINAAWNGLGKEPQMSPQLVKSFTDAGFDWGGNFKRKDGMHFQLMKI